MKRPVFIYAEDIKHYTGERNFYRDFRSLPFDLAENNDELVNSIMQFNEEKYLLKMNKFLDDLGLFEKGNASEVIVDLIVDQLKKYKGKSYSFQLDG